MESEAASSGAEENCRESLATSHENRVFHGYVEV